MYYRGLFDELCRMEMYRKATIWALCRPSQEMRLMPTWRGEWRDPVVRLHLEAMRSYETSFNWYSRVLIGYCRIDTWWWWRRRWWWWWWWWWWWRWWWWCVCWRTTSWFWFLLSLIPFWDSLVLFARYPPINKDDPNRCQWRTSYISQANVSPRNHPGNRFRGCSNVKWFFCLEKFF